MTRRNLENNELGGVIREKINDNFIDLYNATGRGLSVLPTLATRFGVSNRIYNGAQFVDEAVTTTYSVARNSTATYVDPTGKIRIAGVNEPRLTFDPATGEPLGLLVEEQRTNLLLWSESLGNSLWATSAGTKTANSSDFLGRGQIAGLFTENTTNNAHGVLQSTSFTIGNNYTLSFFVKSNGRGIFQIAFPSATTDNKFANFNLVNLAVTSTSTNTTASIKDFGGGWYRISATTAATATGVGNAFLLAITSNAAPRFSFYVGDGVSGFYWCGGQLEQASTPSSYIPTEASAVTRLADNVSRTFNAEWNAFEGCFIVESRSPVGQIIATVGAQTIVSDSAQFKKYALHYSTLNAATSIVIGNGEHRSLEYRPKQLTSAQREALLK